MREKIFKISFALAIMVMASGCATRRIELPDGTIVRDRVAMPQVGIDLGVINNCAPWLVIDSLNGREVSQLAYSMRAQLPIPSKFVLGNSSREIWVIARAYSGFPSPATYIGSLELREYVSTYQGTQEKSWRVDRLDSPQGARCPSQQ
jgi:hypothetical protein